MRSTFGFFGLSVASPYRIWGTAIEGRADVVVSEGTATRSGRVAELEIFVPGLGRLSVVDPNTVEVSVDSPLPRDDAFLILTSGPAIGLILHARGRAVLHGNSVASRGRAAVIVGGSGSGKSTLGGCLRRRGWSQLSDGFTVAHSQAESTVAFAGPPYAKLWPDSLALDANEPPESEIVPGTQKRVIRVAGAVPTGAVPVGSVYSLSVDAGATRTDVVRLPPTQALWELIRNYYLAEYIGRTEAPIIFERCAAIARSVPVYKLVRPNNLNALDEVAEAVERTVAASE